MTVLNISLNGGLTLHPASMEPPAQTMEVLTVLPHQPLLVQVWWSIRGRWACFSWLERDPPAGGNTKGWKSEKWKHGCGKDEEDIGTML